MNNNEFAQRAMKIAKNYKTNYFWGAFGWTTTNSNVKRLLNQYPENYEYLSKADGSQFSFDCSGLVKGILWGWNGTDDVYGGAKYCDNGVPDLNAETMAQRCLSVSSNFKNIVIGELLFTDGHVGIYVGNGMAVEATPSWNGGVQISAVGNISKISGLPTRTWKSHGKFKYIEYSVNESASTPQQQVNYKQAVPARYFSAGYAGIYTVNANIGVNVRVNAGTDYTIIKAIPYGSKVQNYGYYSLDKSGKVWLYVKLNNGTIGYICKDYLV